MGRTALLGGVSLAALGVGPASAQIPPIILAIDWPAVLVAAIGYCAFVGCGADRSAPHGTGSELTIPVGSYNQCETDITANGHSFHVLLDSGASGHLTFGKNHSKALGYDPDKLSFNDGSYESANGTGHYAKVTLREVRIGNWSLRDVPAEITQATQSEPLLGLEILHPLNFHLSKGYCHLQLPQTAVAASLHPSPSGKPSAPLRTDIQPASRPPVARREDDPPPGSPLAIANDKQKTGFCLVVMQQRQRYPGAVQWCADYLSSR